MVNRRRPLVLVLYFLATVGGLLLFLSRQELLYDTDAYYHLAVARAYAEEGLLDDLRWTRLSALGEGFGDKEILFHLLLAPLLALISDPLAAGRLGLALFGAAIFTTLGAFGWRTLGGWGLLLPWWLVLSSTELAWRLVRLRPELVSLLLLLLAAAAIGGQRFRLLGLIAALYTLSYTAFQALVGLCVLQFGFQAWVRRRLLPQLLLYPVVGVGLALVLHPHFPKNLEIWVLQNFWFFVEKGGLDVGTEIRPNTTDVVLMVNLGWFLGLATLWRSAVPVGEGVRPGGGGATSVDRDLADAFGVAAIPFALLYLLMSRFSLYALPLITLWILFAMRAEGRRPSARVRLPWRGRLPLWVAALLVVAVSLPEAIRQLRNYDLRTDPGPRRERLLDREAFADAVPAGARVAADWGSTAIYMLWAPQGRYLNALDPLFMAAPYPEAYRSWQTILAGTQPDVPLDLVSRLESEYLALSVVEADPTLLARVDADPRFEPLYLGINALWRLRPSTGLLLDWRLVPATQELPPTAGIEGAGWRPYPRLGPPLDRIEGFVDLGRFAASEECGALRYSGPPLEPGTRLRFAPYGRSRLWLGERLALRVLGAPRAILGRGLEIATPASEAVSSLTVETCRGPGGIAGFYLQAW